MNNTRYLERVRLGTFRREERYSLPLGVMSERSLIGCETLHDISVSGSSFQSPIQYFKEELITLKFFTKSDVFSIWQVETVGRIAWKKLKENGQIVYGVELLNGPGEKNSIRRMTQRFVDHT